MASSALDSCQQPLRDETLSRRDALLRVLIVDDHALFRAGLEVLLTQLMPEGTSIQQAATIREALQCSPCFDVILLDWHLPEIGGLEGLAALRQAMPAARIVLLSGEQNPRLMQACIDEGAAGFIPKDSSPPYLLQALQAVMAGGITLPPSAQWTTCPHSTETYTSSAIEVAYCFPQLTPRQCEVLRAMAKGLTNKLIARELHISDETVKHHLAAVYQALGVRGRSEAISLIAQRGLRVT